jgi:predicted Fe-Mo cluster-binding NifX family protein
MSWKNLVLAYQSALAAPQSFRDAMQLAASNLDSLVQDNVTVTVQVGYRDWDPGIATGAESGDLNDLHVSHLPSALSSGGDPIASAPLEILPTPSVSSQGATSAGGQNGPGDDIAAGVQEANFTGQMSHGVLHAVAPEDIGSGATATILFAPATSVSVPAALANPAAGFIATPAPQASIGHVSAIEAPAHAGDQMFHAGPDAPLFAESGGPATLVVSADPATSPLAPIDMAHLAGPAQGSLNPVTSASVGPHGATAAQLLQALDDSGLSVNGSGIKVGVLSDSFNDLGGAAADEADGALPSASNIQVLSDLSSGGTDEGRAMMQFVHDIAPGASLAFYTADNGEQAFANGILALAAAGCKVICDDVSYFDEPFFQNGVIAQAIQTVEAEGVTYVTSAGNNASNAYQAAWTPISGVFDGIPLVDAESFGGSLVQTITVSASASEPVPLLLEWNQAYGAATADLLITVFLNGSYYGSITNRAYGEATNPWVGFSFTASGTYQIAIENISSLPSSDPTLIKEIVAGDGLPVTISGANSGTVFGHAMTPGVITAGAVSAADTPAFGFSPTSESFSSSGAGTELLFANNGTALSSPDHLNPVALSGLDDIATTVPGGLSDFYGTSAASASLAGVAALMLSANPNLTPAQVEQIMEATALPMSNSAVSGAGLVQVNPAVAAAFAAAHHPPVVTVANVHATVGQSFAASSLFSVTDADGNPITEYEFYDGPVGTGHFTVNGVAQGINQVIDVSAAQLAQTTFTAGPGTDDVYVRAFDGFTWSVANGAWAMFEVTAPVNHPPVVSVADVNATVGQSFAASSLFSVTDADSDTITEYQLYDGPVGTGHFTVNGVAQGINQVIDVSAAQLAQTTFTAGPGTDTVYVRAFDGTNWSVENGSWTMFHVTAVNHPPVVTVADVNATVGQSFAASSLFSVTDADGDTITKYELYDGPVGTGHFTVNGVAQGINQVIDVSAAQLAQTTFTAGPGTDTVYIRAFDGTNWSVENGSWTMFHVTAPVNHAPVVTVADVNATVGQSFAASSLFSVTDADGDSITEYQLYDGPVGTGHFTVNGVAQGINQIIDVSAAQLAQTTFTAGPGTDAIYVRAFDGKNWSVETGSWTMFHVTAPATAAPATAATAATASPAAVSPTVGADPSALLTTSAYGDSFHFHSLSERNTPAHYEPFLEPASSNNHLYGWPEPPVDLTAADGRAGMADALVHTDPVWWHLVRTDHLI